MDTNELRRPTVIHSTVMERRDGKLQFFNYDSFDDSEALAAELRSKGHTDVWVRQCEFDPDEIHNLLTGIHNIKDKQWNQDEYSLSERELNKKECAACAAAWAAYLAPERRKIYKVSWIDQSKFWVDDEGVMYLCDITGLHTTELNMLFHQAGATNNPFGARPWPSPLYDVFREAFRIRFGYEHIPPA